MFVKQHALVGVAAAAVISGYVSSQAGLAAFAGSVLIDADHYAWYVVQFRDGSLRRAMRFFKAKEADHYYCLCVLHTIEAMAVYIAGVLWTRGLVFWFSAGCLLHMVFDVAQSILDGGLFKRKWSILRALFFRGQGSLQGRTGNE